MTGQVTLLGNQKKGQILGEESTGWIEPPQAEPLKNMAGFRNILVHGYDDVDLDVVRSILDLHVNDLATFALNVRARL